MHIYEYLFAGLIIIGLLTGSAMMVTTLSGPTANSSDKDQLKVAAEKIMTQILLDPGYPYDWGSANTSSSNLKVFGLAQYGETSRQAYELDSDKVLRLNATLEGSTSNFVPPSTAADLLNLGHDYGFTLEFNETLQISSPQQIGLVDTYSVTVTSNFALPVIGANVSAVLYYINSTQNIAHEGPIYGTTTYDGSCTFNFRSSIGTAKVLTVVVDYYGAHAAKLYPITSVLSASLLGSYLIPNPNQPYNIAIGADSREIILVQMGMGYETRDFIVNNAGTPSNFVLNSAPEPSAVAVLAVSGDNLLLATRDFSKISYRTIQAIRSAAFAYSLERTVLIGGSTFTVTLYFWRMSS